jgi:hypothetical protein
MDDRELDARIDELRRPGQIEKRKQMLKGSLSWAATAWIVSGVYLSLVADKFALISWGSLLYFLPGALVARWLFGALGHGLDRLLLLIFRQFGRFPTPAQGRALSVISLVNMIVVAAVVFVAASWFANYIS